MAKGIIYVMTSVVPGLIKIGKTGSSNFESRMYQLERHGYSNVVGLKRHFAIETDDYDEKELLLQSIFSKSKLENSELFALDVNLAVQLLSSFEGRQVYPVDVSKDKVFKEASMKRNMSLIPDGEYYLSGKRKGFGKIKGTMIVSDGSFIVKAGSICVPTTAEWTPDAYRTAIFIDNVLQEDVVCNSPSTAGWIVLGKANNGWKTWKDKDGMPIDIFRKGK